MRVPNEKLVIVATRGELLLLEAPLEPTYLLSMPVHLLDIVILHSQISDENSLVSGA